MITWQLYCAGSRLSAAVIIIRKLSLLGSALRDDFSAASDLDVLVAFEPGHTLGLAFFGMQDELSQLFGRNIEPNTPAF